MERPQGQGFGGGMGAQQGQAGGSGSTEFILTEAVKSFSGVCDSDASGKTRVSFTVNGGAGMSSIASGQSVTLADIQASVEDLDDSRVQLTITDVPSENYAESCLLSDGAQAIAAILPTEDGVYQLTVAVRSGTQYVGASQWQFTVGALPFRDVPQSSDAYEAVKFVYDSGLMEGTGGNRFSPDAAVTRAQAITVLARMAGAVQAESRRLFRRLLRLLVQRLCGLGRHERHRGRGWPGPLPPGRSRYRDSDGADAHPLRRFGQSLL